MVVLGGIAALATGCGAPVAADHKQPDGAQAASGSLEVVMAGPPVRKTLTFISTQPARIEAIEQTPIHSKLPGYVAEVLVDFGDHVTAGQPLVKLSVPEMEVDVVQKQALIDQAAAEVAQADAGKQAAESAVKTAESQVVQAEAVIARRPISSAGSLSSPATKSLSPAAR
jgi:multidrug resistance efflux pump